MSDAIYNPDNRTKTDEELDDTFTYHAPSQAGIERHAALSEAFKTLARTVDLVVPKGREKSIVMTHLEEAKMMASAGVARNPETV